MKTSSDEAKCLRRLVSDSDSEEAKNHVNLHRNDWQILWQIENGNVHEPEFEARTHAPRDARRKDDRRTLKFQSDLKFSTNRAAKELCEEGQGMRSMTRFGRRR